MEENIPKIVDIANWREILARYLTLPNGGKYWQDI
jgi:hypothetical protein